MVTRRVSIVIPTHNRAQLLLQTLASIRAQSFDDYEIILVDDASTDATPEVVTRFGDSRLRYFRVKRMGNLSKLRDFGNQQARGEFVAFMDSDDLWHEDKLKAQVDAMEREPGAGWSITGVELFDESGPLARRLYTPARDVGEGHFVRWLFPPFIEARILIYTPTVLVRRSVFAVTGPCDIQLPTTCEHEFWTRLAFHFDAAVLPFPLVRVRRHPANHSKGPTHTGFMDALQAVSRCYDAGWIGRAVYDEMMFHYRFRLARAHLQRHEYGPALPLLLRCVPIGPRSFQAMLRYLERKRDRPHWEDTITRRPAGGHGPQPAGLLRS